MKLKQFLFLSLLAIPQLSHSSTFFSGSFESGSLAKENTSTFTWTDASNTSVVTSVSKNGDAGTKTLQFTYAAGAFEAEQRFSLAKPYPEIWIRYWARVPTNFKHNQPGAGWPTNCKLFALWMDEYSAKGNGPTVIWEFWGNGKNGSDLTVHYSEGKYTITGEHLQGKPFITYPSDQGRWMQILLHVRASSKAGANDGLIETYRRWDIESSFTKLHNVANINIPAPSGGPNGWKAGYFMGWSNPSYVEKTLWYINDVEFSDTSLLALESKPNAPSATLIK
jgi:hypothetical protein